MQIRHLIFGANPRRTVVRIVILIVASVVTFTWLLLPIRTHGISMLPTYESGSLHFVNRFVFKIRSPIRGDVVAIRLAGGNVVLVKRVIGVPGERLEIREGVVHIDGVPLGEPYVRNRRPWNVPEVTLGPGEYFVIGDNRGMLARDHDFGRVDASRIVGRLIF